MGTVSIPVTVLLVNGKFTISTYIYFSIQKQFSTLVWTLITLQQQPPLLPPNLLDVKFQDGKETAIVMMAITMLAATGMEVSRIKFFDKLTEKSTQISTCF